MFVNKQFANFGYITRESLGLRMPNFQGIIIPGYYKPIGRFSNLD